MNTKIISNTILSASLINIVCNAISFFTTAGYLPHFIMIGFLIVISHIFIIVRLSYQKKNLQGTTNTYILDSIAKASSLNIFLLVLNVIVFIIVPFSELVHDIVLSA